MSGVKLDEKSLFQETLIKTQQKQIVELNRKINEYKLEIDNLKTEIRHLRSLSPTAVNELNKSGSKMSNEELIAVQELAKLKDISDERALELDEIKKYDVLVKALKSMKTVEEKKDEIGNLSTDELLQALKTAGSN